MPNLNPIYHSQRPHIHKQWPKSIILCFGKFWGIGNIFCIQIYTFMKPHWIIWLIIWSRRKLFQTPVMIRTGLFIPSQEKVPEDPVEATKFMVITGMGIQAVTTTSTAKNGFTTVADIIIMRSKTTHEIIMETYQFQPTQHCIL